MALVTFYLNDFGIASMANLAPRAYLVPDGPAVIATGAVDYLLASRRVRMILDADGVTFSAEVFPTTWTIPTTRMRLLIEWLNTDGVPVGRDAPPWQFFIPAEDANLSDLIDVPLGPFHWWVTTDPGEPLGAVPHDFILNPVTGDIEQFVS